MVELKSCVSTFTPEAKTYQAYVDEDNTLDTVKIPGEATTEIDCAEVNKGISCANSVSVSGKLFAIIKICEGKSEKLQFPAVLFENTDPFHFESFLLSSFGEPIKLKDPREINTGSFTAQNGANIKVGDLVRYAPEARKEKVKEEEGKKEAHPDVKFGKITVEISTKKYLGLLPEKNSLVLEEKFPEMKLKSKGDWNGPWRVAGFRVAGFTSDPERKNTDDVTRVPDEQHKYAIVYAQLESTKPVDHKKKTMLGGCFGCDPTYYKPIFATKETPLDTLSTENLPVEPEGAQKPSEALEDDILTDETIYAPLEGSFRIEF